MQTGDDPRPGEVRIRDDPLHAARQDRPEEAIPAGEPAREPFGVFERAEVVDGDDLPSDESGAGVGGGEQPLVRGNPRGQDHLFPHMPPPPAPHRGGDFKADIAAYPAREFVGVAFDTGDGTGLKAGINHEGHL